MGRFFETAPALSLGAHIHIAYILVYFEILTSEEQYLILSAIITVYKMNQIVLYFSFQRTWVANIPV